MKLNKTKSQAKNLKLENPWLVTHFHVYFFPFRKKNQTFEKKTNNYGHTSVSDSNILSI